MFITTKIRIETHQALKKYCTKKGERKNMADVMDTAVRQYIGEAADGLKGAFALVVPSEKQLIIDADYMANNFAYLGGLPEKESDSQHTLIKTIEFDGDVVIRLDKTLVLYGDIDVKGNVLSNKSIYVKGNITAGRSVMCAEKIYCDGRVKAGDYVFAKGFNK